MKVIECPNVDLLEPFPLRELDRIKGWIHCYHSYITDDSSPSGDDQIAEVIKEQLQLPNIRSWAVIDKFNLTNSHHEVPLVGLITFQFFSPYNGYFHIMSSRTCWGKGLIDEAADAVIKEAFTSNPDALRLSVVTFDRNRPAKSLAMRHGFVLDGKFDDFTRKNGKPIRVVHMGLLKRNWEAAQVAQEASLPDSEPVASELTETSVKE